MLWVKKVSGVGDCNFPTDSCKFPTEEIMGAFQLCPYFPPKWGFLALNIALLDEIFPTRTKFSDNFPTA